jgi:hypothetical protein
MIGLVVWIGIFLSIAAQEEKEFPAPATFIKTFGQEGYDSACWARETKDGGFIIAGVPESPGGSKDIWLIKTDRYGNKSWEHDRRRKEEELWSITDTKDGGVVVAVETDIPDNAKDVKIVLVNNMLNKKSCKSGRKIVQ